MTNRLATPSAKLAGCNVKTRRYALACDATNRLVKKKKPPEGGFLQTGGVDDRFGIKKPMANEDSHRISN
jgi:hypothetical protein